MQAMNETDPYRKSMNTILQSQNLSHHFLIATPDQDDTDLARRIIYIMEDDPEEGTVGFVINEKSSLTIRHILENLNITIHRPHLYLEEPVLEGGPEDPEHGFIFYRATHVQEQDKGLELGDGCRLSTSLRMLEKMGQGHYPEQMLLVLGNILWRPGRLQQELADNKWFLLPFNRTLMFDTPIEIRWEMALNQLGVRPDMLSPEYGRA